MEEEEDKKRRSTPYRARRTEKDHSAHIITLRRTIEEDYYTLAREKWDMTLKDEGLLPEDWTDMTPLETEAVERALGAHLVDDDLVVVGSAPPSLRVPQHPPTTNPAQLLAPPVLSSSTRSTNSSASSYAFVPKQDLGSDDEYESALFKVNFH